MIINKKLLKLVSKSSVEAGYRVNTVGEMEWGAAGVHLDVI